LGIFISRLRFGGLGIKAPLWEWIPFTYFMLHKTIILVLKLTSCPMPKDITKVKELDGARITGLT